MTRRSSPSESALTPEEQSLAGLYLRGERLRVRPTAPAMACSALLVLLGIVLFFATLVSSSPLALFMLLALAVVAIVVGWRTGSARIDVDHDQVLIKNHWRSLRRPVANIDSFGCHEVRKRWGRLPYSSPWNPPHVFAIGSVRLVDGTSVTCDALTSLPASASGATRAPAERKVDALNRWLERENVRGESRKRCS